MSPPVLPPTPQTPAYDRNRDFWSSALRGFLVCAAVAFVVAITGSIKDWTEIAAWGVEIVFGLAIGLSLGRWVVPRSWYETRIWAVVPIIALGVSVPMTAVVLTLRSVAQHHALTPQLFEGVLPSVFGTTLVMTGLSFMVRRPQTQTHGAAPDAPPAKFLERLPPRLRGAELYAVEAEDHYLRLHTSLGQDLILMRLADAVAELEGVEGARTHRSWWVARAAVAQVEKLDGRAVLTLKDGAEAPVSRGFARDLRAAGWF